jgi:hypothetical protein
MTLSAWRIFMKESKFKNITEDEVKEAYEYQKSTGWTFNNEREFTETTLQNRFNFLLLAYSLFINTYFMVDTERDKLTILFIGLIIMFWLWIGILRAYTRFRILLQILLSLNDKDVVPIVWERRKEEGIFQSIPPSAIIGTIIPIIMLLSFIIGIIFNLSTLLCTHF